MPVVKAKYGICPLGEERDNCVIHNPNVPLLLASTNDYDDLGNRGVTSAENVLSGDLFLAPVRMRPTRIAGIPYAEWREIPRLFI